MSSNNISHIFSSIERGFSTGKEEVELVGSTNPVFISWLLTQQKSLNRPQLVVCPREKDTLELSQDIKSFSPGAQPVLLEPFDESPYSGLYPSAVCIHSRTHFLWRAANARPTDVFITSIEGLLQKTIPFPRFFSFEFTLTKGEEVDLDSLSRQLLECGYIAAPLVEDAGSFSRRGGIFDVFTPTNPQPVRIELFGDQIESLCLFDPVSQRSETELEKLTIVPAREVLLTDQTIAYARQAIKTLFDENGIGKDIRDDFLDPLNQRVFFHGIDYWLSSFYQELSHPLQAFQKPPIIFWLDSLEITRTYDHFIRKYREQYEDLTRRRQPAPDPRELYIPLEDVISNTRSHSVQIKKVHVENTDAYTIPCKVFDTSDLATVVRAAREAKKDFFNPAVEKILQWKRDGYSVFVWGGSQTQAQRINYLLETHGLQPQTIENLDHDWSLWISDQQAHESRVHILQKPLSHSARLVDGSIVFIREEDFFGPHKHSEASRTTKDTSARNRFTNFGDLGAGDFVVHVLHGVGVYEGLKLLPIQGVDSEFIQLRYKDGDRLYLPVYRVSQIQKYSGPGGAPTVDKLGSTSWQKAKIKVRNSLKDLAADLLALYAKRLATLGYSFSEPNQDFREFEATFPYDETPDQAKAISDVLEDMHQSRPMDRLVCGDVGFGKTEVAIRAAFKAVQDGKQVAILVPTTVLAFQHFNTFKKRFENYAVNIAMVSRFSSSTEARKDLQLLSEGKIDIIIGTHRLLSKDIVFKDLGVLVIDEEHKFGVTHKEKIKRLKHQVHVLTLSATPIPRTLNMSLMGVRDLSLIKTPPEDRLSIRTFVTRFDEETIRKAIQAEVQRGGQVYFIHNRVQSINGFADEIRRIVPDVRMKIAHGQMPDEELEKTMLDFYNHEFDVLLCTTIIESGLDIPLANTIVIDRADTFGLAQLYQLRGRVGRSKERSYAYLLIPVQGVLDPAAQERLKVIQENTDLGSGFIIAHHDLELRGSGNILGEDQSGHISAVGYELYMELLQQALSEAKGQKTEEEIEPEINLRIPALIPDSYIEDIRLRLGYYKALSEIRDEKDLDLLEQELVDRFGPLPEQVVNLFGVMLVRRVCKELGVRDISAGPKNLTLIFSESTKAAPEAIVRLATKQSQKYKITPDQKLIIRLNSTTWMSILEELKSLKKQLF